MGIQFPEQYGGAAMSSVDYCICIEELARVDPSVCLSVAAHNGLGAAHIFMFGSEEQKQRYLVPLATGQKLAAWALTEASSGSDAAAMRTTATTRRRQLGDQRHEAVHHPRRGRRHHGRDGGDEPREGQSRHLRIHRRARHDRVSRREEGRQARHARQRDERGDLRELPRARLADARRRKGRGSSTRCRCSTPVASVSRHSQSDWLRVRTKRRAAMRFERKQFGQPIGTFQSIRAKLVDAATRIEAARLLTYRAAAMKDEGQRTTLEAAMAKLYSSEMAVRVAEDGVQIHGGYGFVKDYPAEKYFRDVKLTTIGEGTSEIQRLVIARQLLLA